MALTKEEQEELKHIRKHAKALAYFRTRTKEELAIKVAELEMQIVDYFDNRSLKFEELKEGMWVWDDKEKHYGKVTQKKMWKHGLLSIQSLCWGVFEHNRFYRREVQNCEKIQNR